MTWARGQSRLWQLATKPRICHQHLGSALVQHALTIHLALVIGIEVVLRDRTGECARIDTGIALLLDSTLLRRF